MSQEKDQSQSEFLREIRECELTIEVLKAAIRRIEAVLYAKYERQMPSIGSEWQRFTEEVFGDSPVHPVRTREMRKAFYAGYSLCLTLIAEQACWADEPETRALTQRLMNEALGFWGEAGHPESRSC